MQGSSFAAAQRAGADGAGARVATRNGWRGKKDRSASWEGRLLCVRSAPVPLTDRREGGDSTGLSYILPR